MYEPGNSNDLPIETVFTYENLIKAVQKSQILNENERRKYRVNGENYHSIYGGNNGEKDDFIYLRKNNTYPQQFNGLKFHVSVDPKQMSQAWDIIQAILVKHEVLDTKFANPFHPLSHEPGRVGREITIYAFVDPNRSLLRSHDNTKTSWEEIINEITVELAKNNIQPGAAATGNSSGGSNEHEITGTNYITWRDDREFMLYAEQRAKNPQIDNFPEDISENVKDKWTNKYNKYIQKFNQMNIGRFDNKSFWQYNRLTPEEHINRRNEEYSAYQNMPHSLQQYYDDHDGNPNEIKPIQNQNNTNNSTSKIYLSFYRNKKNNKNMEENNSMINDSTLSLDDLDESPRIQNDVNPPPQTPSTNNQIETNDSPTVKSLIEKFQNQDNTTPDPNKNSPGNGSKRFL